MTFFHDETISSYHTPPRAVTGLVKDTDKPIKINANSGIHSNPRHLQSENNFILRGIDTLYCSEYMTLTTE